jgi:hypothetical protein
VKKKMKTILKRPNEQKSASPKRAKQNMMRNRNFWLADRFFSMRTTKKPTKATDTVANRVSRVRINLKNAIRDGLKCAWSKEDELQAWGDKRLLCMRAHAFVKGTRVNKLTSIRLFDAYLKEIRIEWDDANYETLVNFAHTLAS